MLSIISDQIGDHYAGVTSIQLLIAEATNKLYPHLDIESFADDLVIRGYADCKDLEGIGKSYKIEEDGEKLLNWVAVELPSFLRGSSSPNVTFETIH